MSITTADQRDYVSRLTEYAERDMEYLRTAYEEAHWGQREPTDAQFLAWFAQMAMANPYWPLALPLDDGPEGMKTLKRYERLTGLDKAPNIPGVHPPMGVM